MKMCSLPVLCFALAAPLASFAAPASDIVPEPWPGLSDVSANLTGAQARCLAQMTGELPGFVGADTVLQGTFRIAPEGETILIEFMPSRPPPPPAVKLKPGEIPPPPPMYYGGPARYRCDANGQVVQRGFLK
jgi:hypothetical protein